jgi:hypothetical protein
VVQGEGPEFKYQYLKKERRKETIGTQLKTQR